MVDHYENPRNVGSMDKNDPDVGTGLVGAPACGDVMKLQVRKLEVLIRQFYNTVFSLELGRPLAFRLVFDIFQSYVMVATQIFLKVETFFLFIIIAQFNPK